MFNTKKTIKAAKELTKSKTLIISRDEAGSIQNIPTFTDAKNTLLNTRPEAYRIDDYCKNCIVNCDGVKQDLYTGCIYKKITPEKEPEATPEALTKEQKEAAAILDRIIKQNNNRINKLKAQAAAGVTIKLPKHATTNYKKLQPFITATDNNGGAVHFKAAGYMDLTIEKLCYNGPFNNPVYSICHYGEQNGDLMRDPDITFEYIENIGAIIPLSYRNDYMYYYREVFREDANGKQLYSRHELTGQDEFLYTWLNNINAQGFTPEACESIA